MCNCEDLLLSLTLRLSSSEIESFLHHFCFITVRLNLYHRHMIEIIYISQKNQVYEYKITLSDYG